MKTVLAFDNLVDYAATVITAGSESAALPVANIQHQHLGKVYRTGASTAAEWIKFDLGTAKAVSFLALLAHTLTASDTGLTIQGHTSDSWTSPAFSESLVYNATKLRHFLSSTQTYRWWRILFTKSAAAETRDIGRVFLGPCLEMEACPAYPDGLTITPVDLSTVADALGGQPYAEVKPVVDEVKIEFPPMTDTAKVNFVAALKSVGINTPFILSILPDTHPYTMLYYGRAKKLTGAKTVVWIAGTTQKRWNVSLEFVEDPAA